MKFFRRAQTFDGRDFIALMGERKAKAGVRALPVDVDRASAALPVIAALLRSGKVQRFTKRIEQSASWIDRDFVFGSVYVERNGNCAGGWRGTGCSRRWRGKIRGTGSNTRSAEILDKPASSETRVCVGS